MSLTDKARRKMCKALQGIDEEQVIQSVIHPEIYFKRNSINLLVGRRGNGKTFNVLNEVIKLCELGDKGGYTAFVIITDKTNDPVINAVLEEITLKTLIVKYDNAVDVITKITKGKNAYDRVVRENSVNNLTDNSREKILSSAMDYKFSSEIPHTILLFDDAINIFKEKKYKTLLNLLFQNRQPRLTIFLCVQEIYGVPPQLRRNLDSLWLFGGFTDKNMFDDIIKKYYGRETVKDELWDEYIHLKARDIMLFNIDNDGTTIKIIINKESKTRRFNEYEF
jgi:hypothetical protein